MAAAADSTTARPPVRWTRRLLRWFGIAFVILLILRILLSLLLPLTIRRVAAVYGFTADYERSEINLLIGDAALWHLSLTPKGASEPAIRAGYVRGNISTLSLLLLRLEIWRVEADGVEVQVDRNADGKIPLLDQVLAAVAAPPGSAPKSKPLTFNLRSPLRIDAVRLHGTRLHLRDLSVTPPVQSTVQLNLRTSDLGSPVRPTTFALDVWSDPGLDLLHIEGQGRSDADTLAATASLDLRGLQFAPLDPYLRPLGLSAINRGVYAHGQASVNLRASPDRKSVSGKVLINDITASADRDEFAKVKEISIELASLDSLAAKLTSIRIRDVHAAAFRSAAGKFGLAGVEYVGGGARARGASAGASSPPAAPTGIPFRIYLDELRLENASAAFVDHTARTPVALAAQVQEWTAKNIVIDPQASQEATFSGAFSAAGLFQSGTVSGRFALAGPAPSLSAQVAIGGIKPDALQPYFDQFPVATILEDARVALTLDQIPLSLSGAKRGGKLLINLSAPHSVRNLTITGQLDSEAGAATASFNLSGEGISTASIAPVLQPMGIEPTWTDAHLSANANFSLRTLDDALEIALGASDIELRDGAQPLARMRSLKLDGVKLSADALSAATATLDHPRISATRDREGFVTVAGIRLIGTTEGATAPAPPSPTTAPVGAFPIALQTLRVNSAELAWRDEMLDQPVELTAAADVALEGFRFADDPSAGTLSVSLRSDGLVDQLSVSGTVLAAPQQAAAELKIDAKGLAADKLAAYFPPGIQSQLKNGAFAAAIKAKVQAVADGGLSASVNVRDVALNDAAATLLEVGSFTTAIQRFDPAAGVIAIDEISSAGVQMNARVAADGRLSMLGISVGAPAPGATAAPRPAAIVPADGTAPTQDVDAIIAAAKKDLPLVTLKKLHLTLDRLTLENNLSPGAAPVVLEGFALTSSAPLEIGGNRPENNCPIELELRGAIKPVAGSLTATARAAPFAAEPTAELQFNVEGIRGESITEILPQLSRYIDGSRLSDGKFTTAIEAQLQPDRRGGVASYSRGFGADVMVHGASLTRGGETLAGVETVHAVGARIEPAGGNVIVKTLEITKPAARILKDHQGIEALGVVTKVLAEASTQPTAEAPAAANDIASTQAQPKSAALEGQTAATAPQPAGGEVRIDKLLISGLDVRVEDRSVEPPIILPLDSLDLEATGLSTRMFADSRPVRFSAVVTSGKVSIPRNVSGGIGGAIGDVGMILAGKEKEISTQPVFEDREFFSQVAASGNLVLYPTASGWVKANVNGLELAGLRGFAQAFGVTLGGGILDASVDARIRDDAEVIEARTRTVLTDLQLSEPAGGPISRHFKAPLDVILAAVQDADNSITLPVTVPIKRGELDKGAIVGSALGAMTGVVAAAIASTPVKVVAGVGGLLGGDKDKKPAEPRTVAIGFAAGDASLLPAELKTLEPLLSQLRRDKNMELTLRHELSAGDVSIATRRANLSPDDAMALGGQLRQRRQDLLSQRAEAAAAALAEVASVDARKSAAAVDRLRDIDVQISQIENALDAVLDQLKPGAERQASRRARTAAIELGSQRLDEVRARLLQSRARNADDRVRVVAGGFAPREGDGGGRVVITIIEKKK